MSASAGPDVISTPIVVPQLGESVVEARVARWLKNEGDRVGVGETVVELETDKIDLEVGAGRSGVLKSIERRTGEDVRIGDVLGVIEEHAAGDIDAAPAHEQPQSEAPHAGGTGAAPVTAPDEPQVASGNPTHAPAAPARARATPTARNIARAHTVDLSQVTGTGTGERITRQDVETHLRAQSPPSGEQPPRVAAEPAPIAPPPPKPRSDRHEERIRMSRRRLTIARNLVEAQRTAAMLTTFNEVDMSEVMALRRRQKESFTKRHGVGIGITSFFVKAVVSALNAFPRLNAEIQGEEMIVKHYYDIGIAVGASQGLVVPVIRDADQRSFAELEAAIHDFSRRAEAGSLTLDDLRGGTFTVTNGGVFGSLLSTPILNPPQVGILGLHKIEERPIAVSGEMSIRPMMYVALTYDHRIVDGSEAVQFLGRVKALAEDPGHLLLES